MGAKKPVFGDFAQRKCPVFLTTYARFGKLQNLYAPVRSRPAPPILSITFGQSSMNPISSLWRLLGDTMNLARIFHLLLRHGGLSLECGDLPLRIPVFKNEPQGNGKTIHAPLDSYWQSVSAGSQLNHAPLWTRASWTILRNLRASSWMRYSCL